ncbi:hypothetical protein BXZ70DRAFT_581570 [Cristinia sonorae]|uniref:Uncharacterized protein n=1 Tax=Cristinia sonorae TaxID=1940300 RepID=A0A8K0XKK7_9AGAR|nr:hypothetical protein BXZ70DRAFT_581570 [Cristinia sonorae]
MLSFGLRVTWFSLSLSGLLSSWAVFPAFARATGERWMPLLYSAANTVLQGIFCLGLIWGMDPFGMPHSFCVAQSILVHASWACLAGICTAITLSNASRVFHKSTLLVRLAAPLFRGALVAGAPCAVLAAQAVVIYELNAAQPVEGMYCDGSMPTWVRTLGYAGASLLLVVPSFTLSFLTVVHVTRSRRKHSLSPTYSPSNPVDDGLTSLPTRNRAKRKTNRTPNDSPQIRQDLSPTAQSSIEPLFPSSRTIYPIPSMPDSPSTITPPGRAKTVSRRARYHLPYDWIETRYSPEHTQEPSIREQRQAPTVPSPAPSPSPTPGAIHFVSASDVSSTRASSRVISPALSTDMEKESIRLHIFSGFSSDGRFLSEMDDTNSGSMKWARKSEDSSAEVKSELVFAHDDEDDVEHGPTDFVYEEMGLSWRPSRQVDSSSSIRPTLSAWPILVFQTLASSVQLLAAISPLIDVASRASTPSAFGTQHVALLLAAWLPCIVFGVPLVFRRCLR